MKVKQNNKNKLAEYLKEVTGVDVNPCSLFDIQVVRIFVDFLVGRPLLIEELFLGEENPRV